MKIRFLEDTYIRRMPRTTHNEPLGALYKGAEIEVNSKTVRGDQIEHTDIWYVDNNGFYFWSGQTEIIETTIEPEAEISNDGLLSESSVENSGVPFLALPLAEDVHLPEEIIPAGETRMVPSLVDLLSKKTVSKKTPDQTDEVSALAPPEVPSDESTLQAATITITTEETFLAHTEPKISSENIPNAEAQETPHIETEVSLAPWQNPSPERLNWALTNYRIASDWWQERSLSGKNIRIAILSTGLAQDHPDLSSIIGFYPESLSPDEAADRHGMGTQAAIVAAGKGFSIFGVAPDAQLLVAKIAEQDHLATPEALIAALEWAIDNHADIAAVLVDFPLLEEGQLVNLKAVIKKATEQNVWLVAPVGNSENKKPESRYPACLDGVLSVGAHDGFGQHSNFSARSYELDLLAPGEELLTSAPNQQIVKNLKSTSISAAFTAGFLALIRQFQNENHSKVMQAEDIFDLLKSTAISRRAFNKGKDVEYGHGILNPIEILNSLAQIDKNKL